MKRSLNIHPLENPEMIPFEIHVAEGVYYPHNHESLWNVDNDLWLSFNIYKRVQVYGGYPTGGGTRDAQAHITVLSGDIDSNDITN